MRQSDTWRQPRFASQDEKYAQLHAAALAMHRFEDAVSIASIPLQDHGTSATRIELAEFALRAGVALPHHLQWLDEAAADGADVVELRRQIAEIVVQPGAVAANP